MADTVPQVAKTEVYGFSIDKLTPCFFKNPISDQQDPQGKSKSQGVPEPCNVYIKVGSSGPTGGIYFSYQQGGKLNQDQLPSEYRAYAKSFPRFMAAFRPFYSHFYKPGTESFTDEIEKLSKSLDVPKKDGSFHDGSRSIQEIIFFIANFVSHGKTKARTPLEKKLLKKAVYNFLFTSANPDLENKFVAILNKLQKSNELGQESQKRATWMLSILNFRKHLEEKINTDLKLFASTGSNKNFADQLKRSYHRILVFLFTNLKAEKKHILNYQNGAKKSNFAAAAEYYHDHQKKQLDIGGTFAADKLKKNIFAYNYTNKNFYNYIIEVLENSRAHAPKSNGSQKAFEQRLDYVVKIFQEESEKEATRLLIKESKSEDLAWQNHAFKLSLLKYYNHNPIRTQVLTKTILPYINLIGEEDGKPQWSINIKQIHQSTKDLIEKTQYPSKKEKAVTIQAISEINSTILTNHGTMRGIWKGREQKDMPNFRHSIPKDAIAGKQQAALERYQKYIRNQLSIAEISLPADKVPLFPRDEFMIGGIAGVGALGLVTLAVTGPIAATNSIDIGHRRRSHTIAGAGIAALAGAGCTAGGYFFLHDVVKMEDEVLKDTLSILMGGACSAASVAIYASQVDAPQESSANPQGNSGRSGIVGKGGN